MTKLQHPDLRPPTGIESKPAPTIPEIPVMVEPKPLPEKKAEQVKDKTKKKKPRRKRR